MDAIDKIRSKKGFFVLGYVLMPEHAHFLLASGQCQFISRAVGCLKWYASIQLLAALREKGMREKALWQPRYYDFNVFTKEKLLEKLNYCHLNPIRRGLVNSPGEWVHSSYRNYENNDDSVFRVDRWWDYWKI